MRPLTLDDVVGRSRYAELRGDYRSAVIAHKKRRRIAVGEQITLLFEDRETLRSQVQEMLWVEQIVEPRMIQHELDVYNELMPGDGELSATLFVEITEAEQIRPALDRLVGVDEHVFLVLGEEEEEEGIRARFDPKQLEEDRISAVQYIRFSLTPDQARRFRDPAVPARVRVDHPGYRRETEIEPAVRRSLAEGLDAEPEPLLDPDAPDPAPAAERVVEETPVARILRPARRAARGHLVVEPRQPLGSFLDAPPDRLAALLAEVQRVAAEVVRQHGACRVHADLEPGSDRLRWHVYAPKEAR